MTVCIEGNKEKEKFADSKTDVLMNKIIRKVCVAV